MMLSLTELLPAIHALPRQEKLRLLQTLAADIAREAELPTPLTTVPHTVWAPYDAFDAAATLLHVLDVDKTPLS